MTVYMNEQNLVYFISKAVFCVLFHLILLLAPRVCKTLSCCLGNGKENLPYVEKRQSLLIKIVFLRLLLLERQRLTIIYKVRSNQWLALGYCW